MRRIFALLLALLFPYAVEAFEIYDVDVHGFVSQGFLKSSGNDYYADTTTGSFEFDDVGINFTAQVTEELFVGAQVFARKMGPLGKNLFIVDWALGDYTWREWLGFRFGKIKQPIGIYNEIRDIDAVKTFVFLPLGVYPEGLRDYRLALLGGSVYGTVNDCLGGEIDYEAFLGTIDANASDRAFQSGFEAAQVLLSTPSRFDEEVIGRTLFGGMIMWHPCWLEGLRIGGSASRVYVISSMTFPTPLLMPPPTVLGKIRARFRFDHYIASAEFRRGRFTLSGEALWVDHRTEATLNMPPVPDSFFLLNRSSFSWYVMAEWGLCECLTFGAYYNDFRPDMSNRSSSPSQWHKDLAGVIRWDVTPNWMVKFECHVIDGFGILAGLDNGKLTTTSLLGGTPTFPGFEKEWYLCAAKVTFTF